MFTIEKNENNILYIHLQGECYPEQAEAFKVEMSHLKSTFAPYRGLIVEIELTGESFEKTVKQLHAFAKDSGIPHAFVGEEVENTFFSKLLRTNNKFLTVEDAEDFLIKKDNLIQPDESDEEEKKELRFPLITLAVYLGDSFRMEKKLLTRRCQIGRSKQSEIYLGDKQVGRSHAMITQDGEGFHLVDNGSANSILSEKNEKISKILIEPGLKVFIRPFTLIFS